MSYTEAWKIIKGTDSSPRKVFGHAVPVHFIPSIRKMFVRAIGNARMVESELYARARLTELKTYKGINAFEPILATLGLYNFLVFNEFCVLPTWSAQRVQPKKC